MRQRRTAEAFAQFQEHAKSVYRNLLKAGRTERAKYDREQESYLESLGYHGGLENYRIVAGERISGRAIDNGKPAKELEGKWQSSMPRIIVIDNVLSSAALERLRRFCLCSTICLQPHSAGYIGAFSKDGFSTPLLAQISDELCAAFPVILGKLPLLQAWAFKYDSKCKGVEAHADCAVVKVNLWLTPDEDNLDKDAGGMVVWDVPAPKNWRFAEFNGNAMEIRKFLSRSGAVSTRIPYRANRAVIFDSELFHETDKVHFRQGYTSRRINVTLLYGERAASGNDAVQQH